MAIRQRRIDLGMERGRRKSTRASASASVQDRWMSDSGRHTPNWIIRRRVSDRADRTSFG